MGLGVALTALAALRRWGREILAASRGRTSKSKSKVKKEQEPGSSINESERRVGSGGSTSCPVGFERIMPILRASSSRYSSSVTAASSGRTRLARINLEHPWGSGRQPSAEGPCQSRCTSAAAEAKEEEGGERGGSKLDNKQRK
eukprot:756026-Hanusia_phi.AAC.3